MAPQAAAPTHTTNSLSADECRHFHDDGFVGPFTMCSRDEMQMVAEHCNDLHDDDMPGPQHNRHLDDEVVNRFARHPAIVDRVASLLGDVLLWRTNFFRKLPGDAEIPWHQDWNYWPLETAVVVSAWLAIDDVTVENCAPQFIPGTHKQQVPHIKAEENMAFREMADPSHYDVSQALDMVMKAGQFVLFNERTLHHSFKNNSQKRRLGLAIRYISPVTRVTDYDGHGPQPHRMPVVAGSDRLGFNRICK